MPTGRDDVRIRGKTGSHGQTVKMADTHLGHRASSALEAYGVLGLD